MENVRNIQQYLDSHDDDIGSNDLHMMSLLDVRLGNMGRNDTNILTEVEGNIQRFVPIDLRLVLVIMDKDTTCADLGGYIVMVWTKLYLKTVSTMWPSLMMMMI